MYEYHVLDFETSDLYPDKGAQVTEIALITARGPVITDIYHEHYRVDTINPKAAEVNGYSLEKYKMFNKFTDDIKNIKPLIKYPIFAHNAKFDRSFSDFYGLTNPNHIFFCTRDLAKSSGTKLENNKLITWAQHLKIQHRPHGALSDALATQQMVVVMGWLANLR